MSERGEYRAIYTVLQDGPDYQRLTPEARLTFWTCKLSCGPSGIAAIAGLMGALEERTGYDRHVVERALDELAERGWIKRERNVVWVVDGLRYEPSLTVTNANHRRGVQRHVAGLPRLAIVDAFRRHYAEWLDEAQSTPEMPTAEGSPADPPVADVPSDRPADASAMGSESHADLRKTEDGRRKTETEHGIHPDLHPAEAARTSPPNDRSASAAPTQHARIEDASRPPSERALLELFPSEATRAAVAEGLDEMGDHPKRPAVVGCLRMWASGESMPPTQKATPDEVALGWVAFRGRIAKKMLAERDYSERQLWACIADVVQRRTNPAPPRASPSRGRKPPIKPPDNVLPFPVPTLQPK